MSQGHGSLALLLALDLLPHPGLPPGDISKGSKFLPLAVPRMAPTPIPGQAMAGWGRAGGGGMETPCPLRPAPAESSDSPWWPYSAGAQGVADTTCHERFFTAVDSANNDRGLGPGVPGLGHCQPRGLGAQAFKPLMWELGEVGGSGGAVRPLWPQHLPAGCGRHLLPGGPEPFLPFLWAHGVGTGGPRILPALILGPFMW